jgi:peptidoglycan/xylan/chitin deacetylase (PgdA/CDA1 family)
MGKVLDALAGECVKANFFVVGEHARAAPELVRRESAEGHTIGTHSETHADLAKLSLADAEREIRGGIEAANLALAPTSAAAPFFRAPYLSTTPSIENYLTKTGLMLWSIDADSEDWRPPTMDEVVFRTVTQLEQKGSGIILMHDVQSHTASALPKLLSESKSHRCTALFTLYMDAPPKRPRTRNKAPRNLPASDGLLGGSIGMKHERTIDPRWLFVTRTNALRLLQFRTHRKDNCRL